MYTVTLNGKVDLLVSKLSSDIGSLTMCHRFDIVFLTVIVLKSVTRYSLVLEREDRNVGDPVALSYEINWLKLGLGYYGLLCEMCL